MMSKLNESLLLIGCLDLVQVDLLVMMNLGSLDEERLIDKVMD